MNVPGTVAIDQRMLHDLLEGLSVADGNEALSVGIVGAAVGAAQPPEHCLRTCLAGEASAIEERGCPLLIEAARAGRASSGDDPAQALASGGSIALTDQRCPKGFRAAALSTTVGGLPAVLLTLAGRLPAARAGGGDGDLLARLHAAAQLVQRMGQLCEENAGFANEVLQNYEQLNLVFDLAQHIAEITDPGAIEQLVLQRVARLLGAAAMYVVTSDEGARPVVIGNDGKPGTAPAALTAESVAATVSEVRRTRQVQAGTVNERAMIAGPLVRLDDRVDVVLALAPPNRAPFTSGDRMLVESMLAFGSQFISNSELTERLRHMSLEVTRALVAAIDKKDHYTSGHSERVGFLSLMTARCFGLSAAELRIMEWAGLLHDIGKIGIPEEILCKRGKLTPEEFDVIRQHPRMGHDILKPIASFGLVLDGVLYHHEQPDGRGYPEGLKGERIPLVARIIHVADTFDALTSTRSYREAYSFEKAVEIIRSEEGGRIDTEVAQTFFQALDAYRRDEPEDYGSRFSAIRERETDHAAT